MIELSSEMGVSLIDSMGTDESVVHAARVSIVGVRAETEGGERKGLLNFLMKNRHASPFEHVTATFMLEVPIFVTREVQRHRTFSYNEVSGRYSVLPQRFYVPSEERPLIQVGKPGAYTFETGTIMDYQTVLVCLQAAYEEASRQYDMMLNLGIAKEVARDCLPVATYTAFYMTGSLRNFFNFLSLRTSEDALYEIRDMATRMENLLFNIAPVSTGLWIENGRGPL